MRRLRGDLIHHSCNFRGSLLFRFYPHSFSPLHLRAEAASFSLNRCNGYTAVRGAAKSTITASLVRMAKGCHIPLSPTSLLERFAVYKPIFDPHRDRLVKQFSDNHANDPPSRDHILSNYIAPVRNRLLQDNLIGLAPNDACWSVAHDREKYLGPSDAKPVSRSVCKIGFLNEVGHLADAYFGGRVIDL